LRQQFFCTATTNFPAVKNKEFLSRKEIIFSAVEALVGARGV
jgi:hypothetical protein